MIIQRQEIEYIKDIKKWTFIFGRRKTGKTFLVKNFLSYDDYFFVKRDRTILSQKTNDTMAYEAFRQLIVRLLADNKTVVIDEFQRLGEDFKDFLHFTEKKGKVILISSTFHLAKKLLSSNSPLLGLFAEVHLGLIKIEDVLEAIPKTHDSKEKLELAVMLSEPFMVDYYKTDMSPHDLFYTFFLTNRYVVPALVGEVFSEEERTLSAVYEGILRAISCGKKVSTEISSYLYSRTLIEKDNPGSIQSYFVNLMNFGLIRRVPVENKNNFRYENTSPIIDMFYYADEKYNLIESELNKEVLDSIYDQLMPRIIERTVRGFLAAKLGLLEAIQEYPDFDVDAYLMRFKKGEVAVEIKWQKNIKKEDIKRAEEVLSRLKVKRRLFFVPDKKAVRFSSDIVEIVDISDFIDKK